MKVLVGEAERDFREEKCRCETLKRELDVERNVIEQVSSLLIYSNNEVIFAKYFYPKWHI